MIDPRCKKPSYLALLLILAVIASANAFVLPSSPRALTVPARSLAHPFLPSSSFREPSTLSPPALSMVSGSQILATPLIKRMLLVLGTALLVLTKSYKRILWPGSGPDPKLQEPLPPGSMGCPLFGHNIMKGSKDYGVSVSVHNIAKKFGFPSLFRFYAFGVPMVSVTGKDAIKKVFENEFVNNGGIGTKIMTKPYGALLGDEGILYENEKTKHGLLRRLAGAAMTPVAVAKAVQPIQQAANQRADAMLASSTSVKMFDITNDFTLDVAWQQILGLDLETPEEIRIFHKKTKQWIDGFFSPMLMQPFMFPGMSLSPTFRAKRYLVEQVERKLERLERDGPDGSTVSGIYFARDENGERLTKQQVIDNALILIFAGSETSASTLAVAMFLLGLHKDVWQTVKEEQQRMRVKYGDEITKHTLDDECPYLDAVVKETLRIKPLTATEVREVKESLVVDGQQIPRNNWLWINIRETHESDPALQPEDMDVKIGFKPQRWLGDTSAAKPTVWMPFGEGGRRCLGERLAMTEMKIFLATMARKLDFDLVGPTDTIAWKKASIMPQLADGVEVTVRPQ